MVGVLTMSESIAIDVRIFAASSFDIDSRCAILVGSITYETLENKTEPKQKHRYLDQPNHDNCKALIHILILSLWHLLFQTLTYKKVQTKQYTLTIYHLAQRYYHRILIVNNKQISNDDRQSIFFSAYLFSAHM